MRATVHPFYALLAVLLLVGSACSAPVKDSGPLTSGLYSTAGRSQVDFPTPPVLSVFPFDDPARTPELAWLRTGLADMLVAELADNPMLILVQRDRVEEIVREQALQLSGRMADASTVKIGRLIGANVLVVGRMALNGTRLRLDVQLVGVEHGVILGAAAAEGPAHDVAKVAHLLVAKVRTLLPGSAAEMSPVPDSDDLLATVKANQDGEALSREGKLFEALEEFERALRLYPANTLVQSNVARTLARLPPGGWLKPQHTGPDQQAIKRAIERLTFAFETDLGRPAIERAGESTEPSRAVLRVPVRIQMSQRVIDEVVEAVGQAPGVVIQRPEPDATVAIRFGSRPGLVDGMKREGALSRRLYLRLVTREGRTIAVYSGFREWSVSNWIAVEDSVVQIKSAHVLETEARFVDLTEEQVAAVDSMRVTIDRVPHERATVRLDVQSVRDQAGDRDPSGLSPDSRSERHLRRVRQDAAWLDGVSPLRQLMESAWSPPVIGRPWSRGYVPSNERTAVVTLTLDPMKRRVSQEPRLARSSGEADFDDAALDAGRAGLGAWLSGDGFQSLVGAQATSASGTVDAEDSLPVLKLRAQFQLHKDVPALNMIVPDTSDRPAVPVSSSSPRPRR